MSKILTTSGLTYFASEFNKLMDGKLDTKSEVGHTHSDYANKTTTEAHINNTVIHVTEADKVKWNEYQGLIQAIQNALAGTSKIKVVPDMDGLNALTDNIEGDIVYVLDATGHSEAIEGESLGFIYADFGEGLNWVVFSDLKPSLDAANITITTIASLTGVNVQEALESIVSKVVAIETRLAGIDTLIGEVQTSIDELELNKLDADHTLDEAGHNLASKTKHGFMSKEDKVILDGIVSTGGEANQNAFSHVLVGVDVISADAKTDVFEIGVATKCGLTAKAIESKVELGIEALSETDIKAIIDGIVSTPS